MTDVRWRDRAACLAVAPDLFDIDVRGGVAYRPAKAVCARCPVRTPCLAQALSFGIERQHGVWGGMTPTERRALLRRRAARECAS